MGTAHPFRRFDLLVIERRSLVVAGLAAVLESTRWQVVPCWPDQVGAIAAGPGAALVSLGIPEPALATAALVERGRRVGAFGANAHSARDAVEEAGAEVFIAESAPVERFVTAVEALSRPRRGVSPRELGRRLVADGNPGLLDLTRREGEILSALVAGLRPAEIAARDFVSVTTVRNQVQSILTKLNAHSQLEAVAIAGRHGWFQRSA